MRRGRKRSLPPPDDNRLRWIDFPECSRNRFCKVFLEEGIALFERPEVQADFERWKAEREKKKKSARPAKTGNTLKLTRASVIIVHHTKHKANC